MKTKISKILGLGLALVMVLSMAFALLPAKVEAAPCVWTPEVLPGTGGVGTNTLAAGTDVTDIAIGPDGTTIWVIAAQGNSIFRSTNGGRTFAAIGNPGAAFAVTSSVAVAPDNPNVAIVSDGAGPEVVFLTTDGGINWATLGSPGTAFETLTDIALSPAIPGSLIGRHYFATLATDAAGFASGDVMELGTPLAGAGWLPVLATVTSTHDYMAIECTPGYLGDRSVVVLGVATAPGAVDVEVININTGALFTAAGINGTSTATDFEIAAVATAVSSAEVSLPIDFDATYPGGIRVYAGYGTQTPVAAHGCDAYRIDGPASRALSAVIAVAIESVSFSGTIAGGSLFIGESAAANVRYSNDPTSGAPTWANSAKPPTADPLGVAAATTIVRVAAGFQTNSNVFAGTSDAGAYESALSLSRNGGFSFNQISLIDTVIDGLSDVMPTPDGKTMFLATFDAAVGGLSSDIDSLWTSPVPSNAGSWDRIDVSGGVFVPLDWGDIPGESIVRLNPDWATTPRLYWCSAGATLPTAIQTSPDAGNSYQNRIAPAATQDVVAEDGGIVYLATSAAGGINVYRSANATYTWGPAVNGQAGPILTLAMAPSYPLLPVAGNLLVGGASAVGISTDGAATFARSDTGLAGAGALQVLGDQNYATNSTIYAGDTTGPTGATYVSTTAAGASWANMINPGSIDITGVDTVTGLGMENGVFYGLRDFSASLAGGADRTLVPLAPPGTIPWTTAAAGGPNVPVQTPLLAGPSGLRVAGGTLFAVDTIAPGTLVTYGDILQTATTTITSPAGGATIPIDPVNGRAELVTLKWNAMGFGPGLVNAYNIIIFEKALGVPGGTFFPIVVFGPTVTKPSVDIFTGAPVVNYSFLAGREYGIVVQAAGQVGGDAIDSPWSDPVFFSIQFGGVVTSPHGGPILQSPQPGAQNVNPGVAFSWAIISGATSYEFILATDAALTTAVAGTPVTVSTPSFGPVSLEYDTDYWYAVRATAPATSPQSIGAFHTMAEPVPPPPPVEIPPAQVISPAWIWAVVIIGAILVIAVIFLIVSTRRSA